MTGIDPHTTVTKKISFVLIIIITILIVFGLFMGGYFTYKKLTLSYDYCKSFGEIDSEIGWTLKKDFDSCLTLKNYITGEVYFDTTIYTDSNGFRIHEKSNTSSSSVLAIGDSWTFGYGVNGDETYPYFLSKLLDEPVHNSGVPAYGSASSYLYAKSNIEKLKPKTVIYLTIGLWQRSACLKPWDAYQQSVWRYANVDRILGYFNDDHLVSIWEYGRAWLNQDPQIPGDQMKYAYPGKQHAKQLIPCYLVDQDNFKAKLVKPGFGVVEKSIKNHVYPGGSLTAGYDSFWRYAFITKPKLVIQNIKEYLGLAKEKSYTPLEAYNIKKYELNSFLDLAYKYNFQFVLVDPNNSYKQIIINKDAVNVQNLIYIGKSDWHQHVVLKSQGMTASDIQVPMDGHFGKGKNELIANLIYQKITSKNPN